MTTLTQDATDGPELPFHVRGNYAPVTDEVSATDLPVIGSLPAELSGRYLRNGPNPRSGRSAHWFLGDGMIHGIRLQDGRAEWYRNRWVRTRALDEPGIRMVGDDGSVDRTIGVANTHVVGHAGRILALVESSFPLELTPESVAHDFGEARIPGEPVFVARHGATREDNGFLLTYVFDQRTDSSEFVVLDATDMAGEALARVPLPQRVPFGFHGSWIPDAE